MIEIVFIIMSLSFLSYNTIESLLGSQWVNLLVDCMVESHFSLFRTGSSECQIKTDTFLILYIPK